MPFENTQSISLTSGAAVTQSRFVTLAADGQVDHTAAAGDADGVALSGATAAGSRISVAQLDGAKLEVEAGEAIAVGDLIGSGANGQARTAVSGDAILGKALSVAAAAGEIITIIGRRGSQTVA